MNTGFIIIIITCPSGKEAKAISARLLEERLVACANIIPGIRSIFRWKGKIRSAGETIVLFKAKKKDFKLIEREIKRLHSYDVPEIVAVPILTGSSDYLKWIAAETRG